MWEFFVCVLLAFICFLLILIGLEVEKGWQATVKAIKEKS